MKDKETLDDQDLSKRLTSISARVGGPIRIGDWIHIDPKDIDVDHATPINTDIIGMYMEEHLPDRLIEMNRYYMLFRYNGVTCHL